MLSDSAARLNPEWSSMASLASPFQSSRNVLNWRMNLARNSASCRGQADLVLAGVSDGMLPLTSIFLGGPPTESVDPFAFRR